jgi:hypothetical protein
MSLPRPASLLLRLGLPTALALLWMACGGNVVTPGHGGGGTGSDPCCPPGETGPCLGAGCASDADCMTGSICDTCTNCYVAVTCGPGCPSGSTCDVPSGDLCTAGASCTSNADCPTSSVCDLGSHKCYLVHP